MKVRIVLQSRSKSNRLPFKSLTNINGYPLAILCAKRLENTGREVVIATSDSKEDDRLIQIIRENKIKYIRGSLENVYQRYLDATKDLKNNDILIRATADNAFVDGFLIDELVNTFKETKKNYLNFSKKHNTPYGLGAEIMKVGILRSLKKVKLNKNDKEHVTLKLKKQYGEHSSTLLKKFTLKRNYNHLRMTIDTIDDYIIVNDFFKKVKNPIISKSSILLKKFIRDYQNLRRLFLQTKKKKKITYLRWWPRSTWNNQISKKKFSIYNYF